MNDSQAIRMKGLDQFYTNQDVAKTCIDFIQNWDAFDLVIEPSAGNGSFYLQLPSNNKIGIDIEPKHDEIYEQDFFTYTPSPFTKHIMVIGNPPFGRVCSTAIKFFNHAAVWASTIAFIIPKTFRRVSMQNRLHPNFHLIHDHDIPSNPCSFTPPMMVKCCFQIWERRDETRPVIQLETKHPDWEFLPFGPLDERNQPTPPPNADFAVKAYGGACGTIVTEYLETLRPKSWHWIKANIPIEILIERFKQLDYSICENTARQNSIGRGDFVGLYKEQF